MLSVELAFMLSTAEKVEPFLGEFQTDKPTLLFLSPAPNRLSAAQDGLGEAW